MRAKIEIIWNLKIAKHGVFDALKGSSTCQTNLRISKNHTARQIELQHKQIDRMFSNSQKS